MLSRSLERERSLDHRLPRVDFLEMAVDSTVDDTFRAAQMMCAAKVSAIVVLGGDGTHRAVARECGDIPIAGLSTGTNNAFPEMREPTITGIAVGLYASGHLTAGQALTPNKILEISINGGARRDIALVDVVVSIDRFIGARALWKTENLRALYVTYADPEAIGMSAIAGLLHPIGRRDPAGCAVELTDEPARRKLVLHAPIAPGMVRPVGIGDWQTMRPNQPLRVAQTAGVLALDGEREIEFDEAEDVTVTLRENAFRTVDVSRCMQTAAAAGLFRTASLPAS